ncbi:hypothetical protein, partial [Streptomyces sp. EAG2]
MQNAPADVLREEVGVESDHGQQRLADRAQPVAAVVDEVDPARYLEALTEVVDHVTLGLSSRWSVRGETTVA